MDLTKLGFGVGYLAVAGFTYLLMRSKYRAPLERFSFRLWPERFDGLANAVTIGFMAIYGLAMIVSAVLS